MVANNELSSSVIPLMLNIPDSPQLLQAKRKITRIMKFFAELLDDDDYFGGSKLSLGDIVAGNAVILIDKLGVDISQHKQIKSWCDRLMARQVWQETQLNEQQIAIFKQTVQKLMAK
ncbi:MAG: glutathione binding-like protein [Cyanobacteria bacterium J06621_8]